ncbi:MAG: CPBP family intramembrane metalloprotease, partial [Oscillospiraceae bacterium]|nr:CPBP family intramembrane metalloprotease [Oscillospiraceae bacterium]
MTEKTRSIRNRYHEKFGRLIRSTGRFSDIFPIAVFLSLVITLFGSSVSFYVMRITPLGSLLDLITGGDGNLKEFLWTSTAFFGIWIVVLVVMLRRSNRPMFSLLFPGKGQAFRHFCVGTLLGFCSNAFCVVISVLLGDIKLTYSGFKPVIIIAFMIAVFIQSGAEELTDRMYLYSKLRRRYVSPLVAVILNSGTFAALHAFNDGFTLTAGLEILATGLLFSLFVYWYDGLWIAMAFHAAWNFTQSIFFGLPNSGVVSSYSVFKLDAASAENGFFYNVGFGVEGSVGSLLVNIAIAAAV